ncbi:MAG: hypothetical protein HRU36_01475 [Rickettsiales bacterium]|nr:hypothetical protein [Rickettsiales bacterium]
MVTQSTKFSIIKVAGILVSIGIWEYGSKTADYASHKIKDYLQSDVFNNLTNWFSVEKMVAVTLSSQIFVKSVMHNPPAIAYLEKSIIGLGYYTLTATSGAVVKSYLDNFKDWDSIKELMVNTGVDEMIDPYLDIINDWDESIKDCISITIAIGIGASVGRVVQDYTSEYLFSFMDLMHSGHAIIHNIVAEGVFDSIIEPDY